MQSKIEDISKIIKAQIQNYQKKIDEDEIGYVISVGDGISRFTASKSANPTSFSNSLTARTVWLSTSRKTS